MQSDATWKETQKFVRVGFWGANVGLALMIVLDLFPGGVIQLWDSVANGYWHARRLTFLMGGTYHRLEWLRMVGDVVFLFAGSQTTVRTGCVSRVGKGGPALTGDLQRRLG
jgi:nitric oxide reductase subunit B